LRKFGLLQYLNIEVNLYLNQKKFRIPILASTGIANLTMLGQWMIPLIEAIVSETDGIFIDVGANTGQTLLNLKSVSPKTEYLGYEPNPMCVHYLTRLIKSNNFKPVSYTHLTLPTILRV